MESKKIVNTRIVLKYLLWLKRGEKTKLQKAYHPSIWAVPIILQGSELGINKGDSNLVKEEKERIKKGDLAQRECLRQSGRNLKPHQNLSRSKG